MSSEAGEVACNLQFPVILTDKGIEQALSEGSTFQTVELMNLASQGKFQGYIRDGLRNGPGVEKWDDGTLIDTNFVADKMSGQTLFREADGA